jgi:protein-tyrosine phosphatase
MKYALTLSVLGLALVILGFQSLSFGRVFLIWLGTNFLLLGFAHLRRMHRLFGKRVDGTLPWWSWLVFLPLHALTMLIWHAARIFSSEPPIDPVTDQLSIGRRLFSSEIPAGLANYVDLTAEFQEAETARSCTGYLAFPILDGSIPSLEALDTAISNLRPGPTLVHCAQGHGRTGLFTLALLLKSDVIGDVDEGLELLGKIRPALRLNADQLDFIRAYADGQKWRST